MLQNVNTPRAGNIVKTPQTISTYQTYESSEAQSTVPIQKKPEPLKGLRNLSVKRAPKYLHVKEKDTYNKGILNKDMFASKQDPSQILQ